MDKTMNYLDQHFQLPAIRQVPHTRALQWLRLGWNDLLDNLAASLPYGVFFALAGYLLLAYAIDLPYLFTASISGFFLIGPLAAAGLYEISRRTALGAETSLADSLRGLRGHRDNLLSIGLLLALMLVGWERVSAVLFALMFHGEVSQPAHFLGSLFTGEQLGFAIAYLLAGSGFAALVFSLTVVAVPMLMSRDTDMITAMMSSARAVARNPGAMAVWAALIVALVLVGFASLLLGLVVIMPLLGHASWHAYQDLVD